MKGRLGREWSILLLAVQFLTRLPVPSGVPYSAGRMAATPRWYPGVGVLIGAVCAVGFVLAAQAFAPVIAGLIAVGVGMILTGCLHEDGFADTCDGLGGAVPRDRALEIMRDSRIGTYGAAGLGLLLALKVAALASVPVSGAALMLVAGHAAGRASMVLVMATSVYVRADGAGAAAARGFSRAGLGFALATGGGAVLALGLALPALAVAGAVLGLGVAHVAMRVWFERRLGGYTGDCLGAVQQTGEVALYLGVLACL